VLKVLENYSFLRGQVANFMGALGFTFLCLGLPTLIGWFPKTTKPPLLLSVNYLHEPS
jgi:hypothetical protein